MSSVEMSSETDEHNALDFIDDPIVKYKVAFAFVVVLLVMVLAPLFTCYVLPMIRRRAQYQPIADV